MAPENDRFGRFASGQYTLMDAVLLDQTLERGWEGFKERLMVDGGLTSEQADSSLELVKDRINFEDPKVTVKKGLIGIIDNKATPLYSEGKPYGHQTGRTKFSPQESTDPDTVFVSGELEARNFGEAFFGRKTSDWLRQQSTAHELQHVTTADTDHPYLHNMPGQESLSSGYHYDALQKDNLRQKLLEKKGLKGPLSPNDFGVQGEIESSEGYNEFVRLFGDKWSQDVSAESTWMDMLDFSDPESWKGDAVDIFGEQPWLREYDQMLRDNPQP